MKCCWQNCNKDIEEDMLLAHISIHVGYKRDGTFKSKCGWQECTISQRNRTKLMSHVMSHLDLRPYPCVCEKNFKRKGDLSSHQQNCKKFFESLVETLFDNT